VSRLRLTRVLDWLALLLIVAALAIAASGGLSFRVAGTRVTARSPERAAIAALALIALRVALDRRTRPLSDAPLLARWVRDHLYDRRRDDVAALPHEGAWRRRGLAIVGFCAFAAVLLFPQLRQMGSVPDLGDPLFSIWRFSWVYHKLLGDPRPLFSPNIFHPHELTLTYSDSMLLPALTTAPLLAAGLHPVIAYNVMMVASFVASAVAMYFLVERVTGSSAAAFISGLLFGFYPYRFEHYSHFELQMTYCMPLALLALHRFAESTRTRYVVAAGLLAVGQLYSSMYYAVFFVMYTAVVFACLAALMRVPIRKLVGPCAIAALLSLLLAWPLARTYRAANLGDRAADTVAFYSATPADYLRAHPRSATWGDRGLPGRQPERALFPGLMILVLAGLALVPPLGLARTVYAAGLLVAFEISRGFNGPFYGYLYDWLPFVRGLRVPARCSLLVGMTLALLAGFGVRRLLAVSPKLDARRRAWTAAVLGVLIVAVAFDLRPRLRLEPVWPDPPPIYGRVADNHSVVLAEFPFGGNPSRFTPNVPFMYFSLWHWATLVNGYSGHYPPGQVDFEVALKPFPEPPTLDLLRTRGTTHVSVNCALYYRGGCDELLSAIEALPDFTLVAAGLWQGRPVRLYELKPELKSRLSGR
jgi:hypothetical protein